MCQSMIIHGHPLLIKPWLANARVYAMMLSVRLSVCSSVTTENCQVTRYVAAPGDGRGAYCIDSDTLATNVI